MVAEINKHDGPLLWTATAQARFEACRRALANATLGHERRGRRPIRSCAALITTNWIARFGECPTSSSPTKASIKVRVGSVQITFDHLFGLFGIVQHIPQTKLDDRTFSPHAHESSQWSIKLPLYRTTRAAQHSQSGRRTSTPLKPSPGRPNW